MFDIKFWLKSAKEIMLNKTGNSELAYIPGYTIFNCEPMLNLKRTIDWLTFCLLLTQAERSG